MMRPTRGRPLRSMMLLLVLWIGARLVLLSWEHHADRAGIKSPPISRTGRTLVHGDPDTMPARPIAAAAGIAQDPAGRDYGGETPARLGPRIAAADAAQGRSGPRTPDAPFLANGAHAPGVQMVAAPAVPETRTVFQDHGPASPRRYFNLYAYGFYRAGRGPAAITGTRYGGSQAGAIAALPVAAVNGTPIEILSRLSYAPDDPQSLEPGAGLRWTPTRGLSVAAEYRRRADGIGTAIAYMAGGPPPIALPADFALELYGQAGLYRQNGLHGFYDGQASVMRTVAAAGPTALSLGGGAWSGGTQDVQRLDIGPRLALRLPVGALTLAMSADYRFRMAGAAAPGSGPALTIAAQY
ncbi:hypothetical protein [Novosphingopyxis baekryungensis]|uniref:hypothetical protein n=1 Tax=Novosphingopyxis baekryungensis TaxID=279369 RepID=UPI0003B6D689|nr:hypothetical protein [Novosphingopyxis baekryungensis]